MYSISATGLKSNPKLEQQNLGLQGNVNQGVSKFESLYPQKTKNLSLLWGYKFHPLILTRFLEFQLSKYSKVSPLAFQSLRVEPKKNILSQRMTVKTRQNQNRGIHCQ